MKTKHKIIIRILILTGILLSFNFIYKAYLYEKDIQEHSEIIGIVRNLPADCEVVYFAESSNFTSHKDDNDKRRISEFAADYYPGLKFHHIDNGALHAGNYRILMQHIEDTLPIKTIIVTLNLRSFGADWIYSRLETSLQKQMMLLHKRPPLANRFLLAFKAYDIKTEEERRKQVIKIWAKEKLSFPHKFKYNNTKQWDRTRAKDLWSKPYTDEEREQIVLGCHYIKSYGFQIDTNRNPRIEDFDYIVKYAKKRGWNVVFNLMAENTEKASRLVEKELLWLMRQNRNLLVERYTRQGAIVVDNLEDVPDKEYIDQNWTTEHYAETGRKIIARNLADSLKQIYPDYYRPVQ